MEYITFSTIFEIDSFLFEIALKVEKTNEKKYKENYKDILFNFYHQEKLFFSVSDELLDIQNVDLSKY